MILVAEKVQGRVVRSARFLDGESDSAHDFRFGLEIKANREGREGNVVWLQANSEATMRRTHGNWFTI